MLLVSYACFVFNDVWQCFLAEIFELYSEVLFVNGYFFRFDGGRVIRADDVCSGILGRIHTLNTVRI